VTGYGGLGSFVDSDGTVCAVDPSPPPDRLERDRERAHALRSRVRNQRLLRAMPGTLAGCFGHRRRLPQPRRARPPDRRSTVSSRDGPRGDDPDQSSSDDDPPRPPGPAQLLAALVKRGLKREYHHEVATFILLWDRYAPLEEPRESRVCVCGCGRSLKDRRVTAKYFDGAVAPRPSGPEKRLPLPRTPKNADVTVPRLPTASDGLPYASEAA
jgi:hypothetical protein